MSSIASGRTWIRRHRTGFGHYPFSCPVFSSKAISMDSGGFSITLSICSILYTTIASVVTLTPSGCEDMTRPGPINAGTDWVAPHPLQRTQRDDAFMSSNSPESRPDPRIAFFNLGCRPFFLFTVTLSVPLLRSRQQHNLVILFVLAALTAASLMAHLQVPGYTHNTAPGGIHFDIYLVVLLIAILGGRVILFFTERGIDGATTRRWTGVDYAACPVSTRVISGRSGRMRPV
jgi:NnrS protein